MKKLIVMRALFIACAFFPATTGSAEITLEGTVAEDRGFDYATKYRGIVEDITLGTTGFTLEGAFTLDGLPHSIRLRGIILTTTFRRSDIEGLYVACRPIGTKHLEQATGEIVSLRCFAEENGSAYDVGDRLVEQGKAVDVCKSLQIAYSLCDSLFDQSNFFEN